MDINEIVKAETGGAVTNNLDIDEFLGRFQLIHDASKIRKNWKAEMGPKPEPGEYFFGRKRLGRTFSAVSIFWRDHALQTKGDDVTLESFEAPDRGSPAKNIEQEIWNKISLSKREGEKGVQNRIGKDVLFWYPEDQKFGVFFFANTATREANNATRKGDKGAPLFGNYCSFTSYETPPSKAGFQWWLPAIEMTWPIPEGVIIPNDDDVKKELQRFVAPIPKGLGRLNSTGVDGRPR